VTTVPGTGKQENEIWERFRKACDDVFGLRQRMLDERDQLLNANRDPKEALCTELESLLRVELEALEQAEREFRAARSTWKEIGPVPKPHVVALEDRFVAVQEAFESRRQTLMKRARHAQLELLRQRAELCAEAESAVHGSGPERVSALIDTLHARWDALPSLDDKADEDAIRRRSEAACAAARGVVRRLRPELRQRRLTGKREKRPAYAWRYWLASIRTRSTPRRGWPTRSIGCRMPWVEGKSIRAISGRSPCTPGAWLAHRRRRWPTPWKRGFSVHPVTIQEGPQKRTRSEGISREGTPFPGLRASCAVPGNGDCPSAAAADLRQRLCQGKRRPEVDLA